MKNKNQTENKTIYIRAVIDYMTVKAGPDGKPAEDEFWEDEKEIQYLKVTKEFLDEMQEQTEEHPYYGMYDFICDYICNHIDIKEDNEVADGKIYEYEGFDYTFTDGKID